MGRGEESYHGRGIWRDQTEKGSHGNKQHENFTVKSLSSYN